MNNVPKIIAVANEEGNPHLRALCDEAKQFNKFTLQSLLNPRMCIVSRSILATLMLAYLLPDTRTAAKSSRLIIFTLVWKYIWLYLHAAVYFFQEFSDVSTEAKNTEYPQPVIIIRGQAKTPKDGYQVVKNRIMSRIDLTDVPIILFASYYVFNLQYCTGCTNVFSFLEVLFLNAPPVKRLKLRNFLNSLENTE